MSFTGRIRLFLIFVAILPPAVIMTVIYISLADQSETAGKKSAYTNLMKYLPFEESLKINLLDNINKLSDDSEFKIELFQLQAGRNGQIELDPKRFGFDFLEILDSKYKVMATYHRPGLLGENIIIDNSSNYFERVEYDLRGAHAAFVLLKQIDSNYIIYTGKYIDKQMKHQLKQLLVADISLTIGIDTATMFTRMEKLSLYNSDNNYSAVIAGSADVDFFLTAVFTKNDKIDFSNSIFNITIAVALASIIIAVFLGIYITGKAKREINNLVSATTRVAGGDFSTPVMAYEEGEFSQLADSFTDMMIRLRALRKQLATSEKIAAWQTVSRKIAHEIKNPLSPISISADDLRRSYYEKLPNFEKTLDETTTTIKNEMGRLTSILDEFVSFALMKQPEIMDVKLKIFTEEIKQIYRDKIDSKKVTIKEVYPDNFKFRFDPDLIKQVLINLIKNGLEAAPDSHVTLIIESDNSNLNLTIEDSGPGFTKEKLANSFEPYVTTKPEGSGLGLVICHRIIHDHNGTMELYNLTDKGAGVKITLSK